jgi:hypothetical protein
MEGGKKKKKEANLESDRESGKRRSEVESGSVKECEKNNRKS